MVSSSGLIEMIAKKLKEYKAENIVVDPVMVATSGARLNSEDAIETLKKELLPLATLITPNILEAEVLSEMEITDEASMVEAAKKISENFGCATLVKGGHQINDANDLLYRNNSYAWFKGKRINNSNTHGTGCTLSSAIASKQVLSSICAGTGCCNKMPCTSGLAFNSCIFANSCAVVVDCGISMAMEFMPTRRQALPFIRT